MPRVRAALGSRRENASKLTWDASFAAPADVTNGYALLQSVELGLSDGENEPRFTFEVASVRQRSKQDGDSRPDDPLPSLRGPMLEVDGRLVEYQPYQPQTLHSVRFWAGIPEKVLVQIDRFKLYAQAWWDTWSREFDEMYEQTRDELRRNQDLQSKSIGGQQRLAAVLEAAKEIKAIDAQFMESESSSFEVPEDTLDPVAIRREFFENARRHNQAKRLRVIRSMVLLGEREFQTRLREKLQGMASLDVSARADVGGQLGSALGNTSSYLRVALRAIKYLGPLREAPRALYDPSPDRLDIGSRGEYAAAVLDAHSRDRIPCPLPAGGVQQMELGVALNLWLSELGLADKAQAKDLGRLGMSLSVEPKGLKRLVDLTAVGVGVSQVMPVVLLCLWSRPNSLILLEQPELHLHPAMQLKLADFLLACSRSNRQIIIETHSEHLVNRLRRRVADDKANSLSRSIGLLFAEQAEGISRYRATTINQLGGLSQGWPEGFLDVGSNEASAFLAEALERRRQAVSGNANEQK